MSFEIMQTNGAVQFIFITTAIYKTWKVWRVSFEDETEVMLYKLADEWMQRTNDHLDHYTLKTIGNCIDTMILEKQMSIA